MDFTPTTANMTQPTAEEAHNGWTAESLTQYLTKQQEFEQKHYEEHMHGPRKKDGSFRNTWPRIQRTESGYDPLRR